MQIKTSFWNENTKSQIIQTINSFLFFELFIMLGVFFILFMNKLWVGSFLMGLIMLITLIFHISSSKWIKENSK
jgi:hypothetical protein